MKDSNKLEERMWQTAGARFAENQLISQEPYRQIGQLQLRRWLLNGFLSTLTGSQSMRLDAHAVLLSGTVEIKDSDRAGRIYAPALINPSLIVCLSDVRLFLCPPTELIETI